MPLQLLPTQLLTSDLLRLSKRADPCLRRAKSRGGSFKIDSEPLSRHCLAERIRVHKLAPGLQCVCVCVCACVDVYVSVCLLPAPGSILQSGLYDATLQSRLDDGRSSSRHC